MSKGKYKGLTYNIDSNNRKKILSAFDLAEEELSLLEKEYHDFPVKIAGFLTFDGNFLTAALFNGELHFGLYSLTNHIIKNEWDTSEIVKYFNADTLQDLHQSFINREQEHFPIEEVTYAWIQVINKEYDIIKDDVLLDICQKGYQYAFSHDDPETCRKHLLQFSTKVLRMLSTKDYLSLYADAIKSEVGAESFKTPTILIDDSNGIDVASKEGFGMIDFPISSCRGMFLRINPFGFEKDTVVVNDNGTEIPKYAIGLSHQQYQDIEKLKEDVRISKIHHPFWSTVNEIIAERHEIRDDILGIKS